MASRRGVSADTLTKKRDLLVFELGSLKKHRDDARAEADAADGKVAELEGEIAEFSEALELLKGGGLEPEVRTRP